MIRIELYDGENECTLGTFSAPGVPNTGDCVNFYPPQGATITRCVIVGGHTWVVTPGGLSHVIIDARMVETK